MKIWRTGDESGSHLVAKEQEVFTHLLSCVFVKQDTDIIILLCYAPAHKQNSEFDLTSITKYKRS